MEVDGMDYRREVDMIAVLCAVAGVYKQAQRQFFELLEVLEGNDPLELQTYDHRAGDPESPSVIAGNWNYDADSWQMKPDNIWSDFKSECAAVAHGPTSPQLEAIRARMRRERVRIRRVRRAIQQFTWGIEGEIEQISVALLATRLGYEVEWCDQVTGCSRCYGAVQTQPDSYSWVPQYADLNGDIVCHACIEEDSEEYLDWLQAEPARRADTLDLDLKAHGYVRIEQDFEHGWYGGQDADPRVIAESMKEYGVTRFVFQIDSKGQFDMQFSLWVHEDERGLLPSVLAEAEHDGPDVAAALARGLQEASAQQATLQAAQKEHGGVIVSKVGTTTVTSRLVSPEDFIAGKALDD